MERDNYCNERYQEEQDSKAAVARIESGKGAGAKRRMDSYESVDIAMISYVEFKKDDVVVVDVNIHDDGAV